MASQADHPEQCETPTVVLTRAARAALGRLEPEHRAALNAAFTRVGHELLEHGEQVAVAPCWSRRTWPARRYPQQCYQKTVNYVRDHADLPDLRLIHGVISHQERMVAPLDHAWVELPGRIVFDGVVQAFFAADSYTRVMSAVCLNSYSAADTERLVAAHGHAGPWNASWIPTAAQLQEYYVALSRRPSSA